MAIQIESLALIGDRSTLAMVTKEGTICWYCPRRFDAPSLFASLLDEEKGGSWTVEWPGAAYKSREYEGDSAILQSVYSHESDVNLLLDFMPIGQKVPSGICRILEGSSSPVRVKLQPVPDYGQTTPELEQEKDHIRINKQYFFYSSHPASVIDNRIEINIASCKRAWMFLANEPLQEKPTPDRWMDATRQCWEKIAQRFSYHGPYESKIAQSIRAIRLLTHEETGGILAAGTTSLPEVPGGKRNYDYRYVWLRDAGMIVSALTRAGSDGTEERRFLEFICSLERLKEQKQNLFAPMYTLDYSFATGVQEINLKGYMESKPVVFGNGAHKQLQLDTTANVLLAAKLIYNKYETREHWETIAETADFLAENWHREDKGIWEENESRHYTSSKVITACGLMYIAEHSQHPKQKQKWQEAERDIRRFVKQHCLNAEGAYAAAAGEEAVDISAILFPSWAYTSPDAPEVLATAKVLERDYRQGKLYHRHLFDIDSRKEGAFLAGSIWMAQYWIYRHKTKKAVEILEEVMKYATDLGFFSEEADVENERMMGNIPQTFVHASLIGAVIDLKYEIEKSYKDFSSKEK